MTDIHVAAFDELPARSLYGILKLRQDVFIVEQRCAYPDMDERDGESSARHLWIESAGRVVSALRLLHDADGAHRIGRVVTAVDQRRGGLANRLMEHAIALAGPPIVLSAQAYLEGWYASFGFTVSGEGWDEDGIWHVPMRLDAVR